MPGSQLSRPASLKTDQSLYVLVAIQLLFEEKKAYLAMISTNKVG